MNKIERTPGNGAPLCIYKAVQGLNKGDVKAHYERWNFGVSHTFSLGIKLSDREVLDYISIVMDGQGLPLGEKSFYGFSHMDKMYTSKSSLVNGTIITHSERKEYWADDQTKTKVGESMPELILTILSETPERLRETANMFNLPLEEIVSQEEQTNL